MAYQLNRASGLFTVLCRIQNRAEICLRKPTKYDMTHCRESVSVSVQEDL